MGRAATVVLGSVLLACGVAGDEATSPEQPGECAEAQMVDGWAPGSIEELFATSDLVAEVTVLRTSRQQASQMEDESIVKNVAELRVDQPYKGASEGQTLDFYMSMGMSNPQIDAEGATIGEANTVPEGATALVSLAAGGDGEYESSGLYGGALLLEGDRVSVPGLPSCEVDSPENTFRATVENTTVDQLRAELTALAEGAS